MKKKMKSTGIVRRLDDLGRIVIPKEICRTRGINGGDAMEIAEEMKIFCSRLIISKSRT